YHSLARAYAQSAAQIEEMTGCRYNSINVIGGGSNADYLNRLTFEYSGKTVLAGPGEATAIGNLSAQLIACGEVKSAEEARQLIRNSFNIKCYER
ncbi:MAG: rhamnulokinase, partial [Clostridia bacterium]|nr:rhamnulokinase [Clostridia bacterium]